MKILLSFFCLVSFINDACCQDTLSKGNFPPALIQPVVYAQAVTDKILVDGKLDEPVWKKAAITKNFFRMEPRQGGNIIHGTFVQTAFDKKNLYFGVFCKDSLGKSGIRVQDLRRDFVYGENDIFFIQLDPQNLRRFCVSFQTTPYGNQRDLQVFDDNYYDNDWDALWKVRTTVTDSGYYAEFAIPFVSLRYGKPSDQDSVTWGITFARLARRDYEQSVFPAIPQAFSPYRMSYAAQIKGLCLPAPAINLRLQPYTLYQYNRTTSSAGIANSKSLVKPGGDIKWAVNTHSVIDFTFNTDFAQADVDRAVNNLTRFNVFFPERRQFFLENSGVYAGADNDGIKPFFSRSIGLANAQFNADPVPIDLGIRVTDRNQDRTIAGMYVHQRATGTQASANFAVFRYLKNYSVQNNVGVMITHRLDEADEQKGFRQRNNTTISVDGFIRPNDTWQIQYLATASRNNTNDSIGFAGSIYAGWFPQNWYAGWVTKWVDNQYLPGMGFVFSNNTVQHNPGGYYIFRPKGKLSKLIRRWDPGFFIDYYHNATNMQFQSARLDIFPLYIIFNDNSKLDFTWHPTWESYFFEPLGFSVRPGHYFFNRYEISYNTDASKRLSGGAGFYGGAYYDGKLDTWTANLRYAPSPKIALSGEYELNKVQNLGIQNVTSDISLVTGGMRLAANPRLQLSAFYQYNSFNKQGRWNIRGSWEFAPLSFIYIVFNESHFINNPAANQTLISKVSYFKQF